MPPRFLDQALLDEFDMQLRRLGAPLADNWGPGLSDEEIDTILMPLGIELPEEARRWWRWHNGALNDHQVGWHYILGDRPVWRLEMAADLWADGGLWEDWGWPPHIALLHHVAGNRPWLFLFCAGERDAPVPIYVQDDIEAPVELLPSIGELVATWTTMLASGTVSIEPDGSWVVRDPQWPFLL